MTEGHEYYSFEHPAWVYRVYARDDELLYVGSTSVSAEKRINDHRSQRSVWVGAMAYYTTVSYSDIGPAWRAEKLAIATEHPRFNSTYNVSIPRGVIAFPREPLNEFVGWFDVSHTVGPRHRSQRKVAARNVTQVVRYHPPAKYRPVNYELDAAIAASPRDESVDNISLSRYEGESF